MMSDKQMNILDLLYIFVRWWRVIVGSFLAVCVVAAVVSLLLPKEYEGKAMILPPKEERRGIGFSEILAALPVPQLRLGERGSPADVFIGIMKSDTVATTIVDKFHLMEHYKQEVKERTIKTLQKRTIIKRTDQGLIQIIVLDRDRNLCAEIANEYIAQLDAVNQRLSRQVARDRKGFIEDLMGDNDKRLREAKQGLQNFLAQHNTISIEDQMRATIEAAAKIEMEKIALQFQLWSLQGLVGSDHPQVKEIENSIKLRNKELGYMRFGINPEPSDGSDERQGGLFIPLEKVPDLSLEYATLEKEVLIQEGLAKYLREQWLQTNTDEVNTVSTVQVVDRAKPPELKAKPKRTMIVLVSGLLSLVFSSLVILGIEYVQGVVGEGGEDAEKLRRMAGMFRWKNRS
jgi:uncharacterized protein involved in exopolysaccharide biosynthesis